MAKTTRTFVAVAMPEDRAARIGKLQMHLATEITGVKWVEPHLMHSTLAFLGDVPDTDLDSVCRAVGKACRGFAPMELQLEGLGAFPSPQRPRTLWVGLKGDDLEPFAALHKAVTAAVADAGYPADAEKFQPHVTLGRIKDKQTRGYDLSDLVDQYRAWSAGRIMVSEVITYSSVTGREGPVYAPLARARLEGRKIDTQA
jgi:2'-5' RNA ligase